MGAMCASFLTSSVGIADRIMFTGIIESVGRVVEITPANGGLRLLIDLVDLEVSGINLGDSIAVSGVCLTLTALEGSVAAFDVSPETLDKTLMGHWRANHRANLEPALTLGKPLGGHLVSGHVDGSGTVDAIEAGAAATEMSIRVSRALGRYVAIKGSVAVDGVSLTTNRVRDEGEETVFDLTLVPHTLSRTTLSGLKPGYRVHIEVDMMARYLDRMMQADGLAMVSVDPQ